MDEETVVRTYADMVYKIAYRYAGNAVDADDIFSETFLKYFKRERTFESEEHRKAWLIRVTINCAKDFLMSQSPWAELNEQITPQQEGTDTDLRLDLRAAIDQLRPEYREAVLLYYMEDLSVREIAQVLDRNENTVKIHLSRARQKLKTYLEA